MGIERVSKKFRPSESNAKIKGKTDEMVRAEIATIMVSLVALKKSLDDYRLKYVPSSFAPDLNGGGSIYAAPPHEPFERACHIFGSLEALEEAFDWMAENVDDARPYAEAIQSCLHSLLDYVEQCEVGCRSSYDSSDIYPPQWTVAQRFSAIFLDSQHQNILFEPMRTTDVAKLYLAIEGCLADLTCAYYGGWEKIADKMMHGDK